MSVARRRVLAAVAGAVWPLVASAQNIRLAKPGDTLFVRGMLEDSGAWTGHVQLVADADVTRLALLPGDLVCTVGGDVVERYRITLRDADVRLSKEVATDVVVQVAGPHVADACRGTIEFRGSPSDVAPDSEVPIVVVGRSKPTFAALTGTKDLQLDLVRCSFVGCWLADLLLPAVAQTDRRVVQFDKGARVSASVRSLSVLLSGKYTGAVADAGVRLAADTSSKAATPSRSRDPGVGSSSVADDRVLRIPIALERGKLASDQYSGQLRFIIDGRYEPLDLPVTLNVRMGPMWPLAALVLGLALGRLAQFMKARAVQIGLLDRADRIEERARADLDGQDLDLILRPLGRVRSAVTYSHVLRDRLQESDAKLAVLDVRIDSLLRVRELIPALEAHADVPAAKTALDEIRASREALRYGEDDQRVVKAIADAESFLGSLPARTMAGHALPASDGRLGQRWSGAESMRLNLARHGGRQALYVVLFVMLALIGMRTFYVVNGTTFGAAPLSDFLTLLIWGLSADATSRTLAELGRTPTATSVG